MLHGNYHFSVTYTITRIIHTLLTKLELASRAHRTTRLLYMNPSLNKNDYLLVQVWYKSREGKNVTLNDFGPFENVRHATKWMTAFYKKHIETKTNYMLEKDADDLFGLKPVTGWTPLEGEHLDF